MAFPVRADEIALGVHAIGSDGLVVNISASPQKILPVLSANHHVLSVITAEGIFRIS